MQRQGGPSGPFASANDLLSKLAFEPIGKHPVSPTLGDVIRYRDGSFAIVGDSPHVSYGPRAEMAEVARLFPRPESPQEASHE